MAESNSVVWGSTTRGPARSGISRAPALITARIVAPRALSSFGAGQRASPLAEINGQEIEPRQLGGKSLSRAHGTLRAGAGIYRPVGLAGHHTAQHVANGQRL